MKIKNSELQRVNMALFSLGSHQEDIKKRWDLTKIGKPIVDASSLLETQVQQLIDEKGTSKEGQQKSLPTNDEDYLKLMDLDIDIDIERISLEHLEQYNPTYQELLSLTPIIKEG